PCRTQLEQLNVRKRQVSTHRDVNQYRAVLAYRATVGRVCPDYQAGPYRRARLVNHIRDEPASLDPGDGLSLGQPIDLWDKISLAASRKHHCHNGYQRYHG